MSVWLNNLFSTHVYSELNPHVSNWKQAYEDMDANVQINFKCTSCWSLFWCSANRQRWQRDPEIHTYETWMYLSYHYLSAAACLCIARSTWFGLPSTRRGSRQQATSSTTHTHTRTLKPPPPACPLFFGLHSPTPHSHLLHKDQAISLYLWHVCCHIEQVEWVLFIYTALYIDTDKQEAPCSGMRF